MLVLRELFSKHLDIVVLVVALELDLVQPTAASFMVRGARCRQEKEPEELQVAVSEPPEVNAVDPLRCGERPARRRTRR